MIKLKRFLGLTGLVVLLSIMPACIRFHPKPIVPVRTMENFETRRLDAPEVKDFFLRIGEAENWPPAVWDLKTLTLGAFYYHPDLDIARAQWEVTRAARISAGERLNPAFNPSMGYNSTTPLSEVTRWIPEISLEILIETAGKRGFRISEARHLSDAARWNILKVAWNVRSRLRSAMLEMYAASERESLVTEMHDLRAEIVRLLEIQKEAGEVSAYEVTQARIAFDQSRLAAIEAGRAKEEALAGLAVAMGLPLKALNEVKISYDCFCLPLFEIPPIEVRRQAVINRSDLMSALSEYAASESALQLEIARQYPDLHLGPGYQLDQTDSKWTVGLSFDLPILNLNRGPIAEAEAQRVESAARFLSLQAEVISELNAAVQNCRSAMCKVKTADHLMAELVRQAKAAQVRRELGEISMLELIGIKLELNQSAQARLDALIQSQEAIGRLENATQSPLDLKDWFYTNIRDDSVPVKERKND
jgi:cobalt-zinc-cadmium efflux system outer membrane protein